MIRPSTCHFLEYGIVDYKTIYKLQKKIVTAKIEDKTFPDIIILQEHLPIYTLGKNATFEHLLTDKGYQNNIGVAVVKIERGGDITYHGPGQIIAYPIVDLKKQGRGIKRFVTDLEEIMIKTAEYFGVKAIRNAINPGIWVENCKLGSIGIAVKRGITSHGLALNVNNDLTPFNYIHPCGLKNIKMTSLEIEGPLSVNINKVRKIIKKSFIEVFNRQISDIFAYQMEDKMRKGDKREAAR